ncbi:RluA family pseudouridine synthase [Apilactobacillus micheneri]|uniref:Pseudouridine synthase n=1 Tax=Apilactobacillus micheneri TaxID=1899430 RepID=A0A9Q8IMN5_9LACO|nr:RluA family pseudouridine synthase [Apilactobacillus micheneri]TPR40818.1 RluA family pseudouridine synthase [Apilactobacillus micheneri]TPR42285.1 RluA family pseudouridine synthase [Apilactobacillus micheneri]TPR44940.1 RluA family pseudouridine synthase [Apilactobacillus micheneri]TPR45239.1 RluA family pseudouridine synthase [Apilactobacillus micheneri]TPR46581.1 RluA family pseudouridine synthase [Apilactobacillus micheneri]
MTEFNWVNHNIEPIRLRTFLGSKGVTRTLLKQVKFHGGMMFVNNSERYANFMLKNNDKIKLILPPEISGDYFNVSNLPIDIIYEDEHFLVVNKPAGVPSIPSRIYTDDTLVNRVKGYFQRKQYENQKIHIVNRLDMDTSGLVIFAKHHFAHSVLDKQFKDDSIQKYYIAIVQGNIYSKHVDINLPIGRQNDSFVKRTISDGGKMSRTEFWVNKRINGLSVLKVKLHTGRTHQIRVHCKAIGHPLIGDWLYNPDNHIMNRQALHCYKTIFYNPFVDKYVECDAPLPEDMKKIIK